MITGEQLRAARAMLRMEQSTLAGKAGVSVETVKRLEAAQGELTGARLETVFAVQRVLEFEGIEFFDRNDSAGAGVRFSLHPTQRYRTLIANHVRDLTDEILRGAHDKDPKLFERDPISIAELLVRDLAPLLRHTMASRLKYKV